MFGNRKKRLLERAVQSEARAQALAVNKSHAIIEFAVDGTIQTANENFLRTMGYTLDEIAGRHHRMFVDPEYAESREYAEFWQRLKRGEYQSGEFSRFAKGGREVWLQASYDPIVDASGQAVKIVKLASDITAQKNLYAAYASEVDAMSRSTGVIYFDLDGTILDANQNFLNVVGYTLAELRGKHHRMLVSAELAKSARYVEFWDKLRHGVFVSGQFKRFGKGGNLIWLEASYNPILDADGRPQRVVKYCTDVTAQRNRNAEYRGEVEAINRLQAVIHFTPEGVITYANKNFLDVVGYSLPEVVGKHHSMFVSESYRHSAEYIAFWKNLAAGTPVGGQFARFGKFGKPVWLNATYTPIVDDDGRTFKVVKFALDVSPLVQQKADREDLVKVTFDKIISAVASVGEQSQTAASASQETAATVDAAAASTEQLDVSIGDIEKSMTASRAAVDRAMSQTVAADESTRQLSTKITLMSEIIKLIQKVAEHINLLSLNASIEAARAGTAGRGFAVVASEIKSLADQVTSASAKITEEINDVQFTSAEVVKALEAINISVESVQGAVTQTATAIKEQSLVTGSITSNMRSASSSVGSINASLGDILQLVAAANDSARDGKQTLDTFVAH